MKTVSITYHTVWVRVRVWGWSMRYESEPSLDSRMLQGACPGVGGQWGRVPVAGAWPRTQGPHAPGALDTQPAALVRRSVDISAPTPQLHTILIRATPTGDATFASVH